MRAFALAFLCIACVACNATPQPTANAADFSLHVQDIDGPPVVITVNGTDAVATTCGDERSLVLRPEQSNLPRLPWVVAVKAMDGTSLESWSLDGSTSYYLLVRRYGPFDPGPTVNPGPGPMLPCPSLYFDTPPPE